MDNWHDYFVAEVGASAALAGLVIVAVSINLERILSFKQLPGRAAEALILLMGALVLASIALMPIDPSIFAILVIAIAGVIWIVPIWLQLKILLSRSGDPPWWLISRFLCCQVATLPLIFAGILLLQGYSAAPYWLGGGIIAALVTGMLTTWVLLVEIKR